MKSAYLSLFVGAGLVAAVATTGTLVGCSDDEEKAGSTTAADSGPTDTADSSTPTPDSSAPTSCGEIAQKGIVNPVQGVPTAEPAPTGGTLTPATYILQRVEAYTGEGGPSGPIEEAPKFAATYNFKADGTFIWAYEDPTGATLTFSGTWEQTPDKKKIHMIESCPALPSGAPSDDYEFDFSEQGDYIALCKPTPPPYFCQYLLREGGDAGAPAITDAGADAADGG